MALTEQERNLDACKRRQSANVLDTKILELPDDAQQVTIARVDD